MSVGAAVPWKHVLGFRNDFLRTDPYVSNTIFCGIKACFMSVYAHYIVIRYHALGQDLWYIGMSEFCTTLGKNFFLWEALDLMYSVYHRIHTWDVVFHHVFHIIVTPFVMGFATPTWHYVGSRLIIQETSGIPLAVAVLFRNESPMIARSAFIVFAVLFFVYRIVNTGHLLRSFYGQEPFLCTMLLPAYVLQWWWFVKIVRRCMHTPHNPKKKD